MKAALNILLFTFFSPVFSQSNITSTVSLKDYCPTDRGQYKATCFAYAPVYTAFSIMKNLKEKRTEVKDKANNAYSDCYVASQLNQTNNWFVEKFTCCGQNGTYLKTLEFLKLNGTCLINDFKEKCVKKRKKLKMDESKLIKIKDYEVFEDVWKYIYESNGKSENYTSEAWIIKNLDKNIPVIIAPQQVASFLNLTDPIWKPSDAEKLVIKDGCIANHVICIVGYGKDSVTDEIYFEIRNNYIPWANNGFAYVKANDFLLFVQDAAIIKL